VIRARSLSIGRGEESASLSHRADSPPCAANLPASLLQRRGPSRPLSRVPLAFVTAGASGRTRASAENALSRVTRRSVARGLGVGRGGGGRIDAPLGDRRTEEQTPDPDGEHRRFHATIH
jgi:hypothetical protein